MIYHIRIAGPLTVERVAATVAPLRLAADCIATGKAVGGAVDKEQGEILGGSRVGRQRRGEACVGGNKDRCVGAAGNQFADAIGEPCPRHPDEAEIALILVGGQRLQGGSTLAERP